MASDCCKLVGNLLVKEDVVSIQIRSSTEVSKTGNTIIVGPTIGNIAISGWASRILHTGCPGRAGVSINWIRKYDCDLDVVYLLFAGSGKSYSSGDVGGLATVDNSVVTYPILNASSASGPTSLYEDETQTDGYGLSYIGGIYPFTTTDAGSITFNLGVDVGGAEGQVYLQSFSLQCTPGAIPMANYDFVFINVND